MWVSESEEATLRILLVQLWSDCLRWQTGSIVRLAADSKWSEDAHSFHHIAAIRYIVHLELLRNSYFFFSVGEGGNVTSGIALVFILKTSFMVGLQLSQVVTYVWNLLSKEESLCVFWEEIWSTAIWE